MKNILRILAVVLLAAMLLGVFVSCAVEKNGEESTDSTTLNNDDSGQQGSDTDDTDEDSEQKTLTPENALLLTEKGRSRYVVVIDDEATAAVRAAADELVMRVANKTKTLLKKKVDSDKPIKTEILIGEMDERDEPKSEAENLLIPGGKGYRISVSGEKIIVIGAEEYLGEAVQLLASAILPCGEEGYGVEKDYEGKLDLPDYKDPGELYNADEGNYTYNVSNTKKSTYDGFLNRVDADGFKLHSTHKIGESSFATYYKDSIYGSQVLYTAYHGALDTMRLTWGPLEYLPPAKAIKEDTKVTPTVTQMHLQMVDNGYNTVVNNGAPGMSYLLQLSDGRFIIIDGGNSDATVNVAVQGSNGQWTYGGEIHTADEKRLYDTMCDMMPSDEDRPTVAMWYFSHVHGDHMNLAYQFLKDYSGKFDLELVAYNFLNFYKDASNYLKRLKEYFPNTPIWIMHTGQVMELPGCTVEVMATPEDFVCTGKKLEDGNDASVVIRITIANTTFMVLGDAYPTTGDFMRDAYGEALESDVLQMAHHGFNGAVQSNGFYELIDPKVCLWPCDEFRFQTDSRNIGTNSKGSAYYMNWWLRNEPWTRGGKTGEREHFTASSMTTINAETGKKIS